MFKKWNIIIAVTLLTLIGGANVTEASATMPAEPSENIETPNTQEENNIFYYFLQNWKNDWTNNRQVEEETVEQASPKEEVVETEHEKVESGDLQAFEQRVFDLTNVERTKNGLAPFKMDKALSGVAREKSNDMKQKGYFDHQSPTYGSPFDMMKQFGITYQSAGENIAMGQSSPEEVVKAWMNSPGHRANILNGSFTHLGVGYVENGNYWTQLFIGQ